ncbi:MAG TPA: alpha/beta hydrolase [Lacunisphaera sp.]|nr:alpha/beta hydrolase [Lacunisphaera sp.]
MKKVPTLQTLAFVAILATSCLAGTEPPVVPLWTGVVPGSEGKSGEEKVRLTAEDGERIVSNVHRPSLTVYLPAPDKATGAAVVVCPGGGHRELWSDHEGHNIARWLSEHGVAAFVLKYRLAREEGSTYQVDVHSLADIQRAIRLVRSRAGSWNLDPKRVGVMGFSAGGEVASLAGMRYDEGKADAADPVEQQGCKPAFQALIYPGNSETILPTKDSPPAFLLCGYGDRQDIAEGIAKVYLKFRAVGVPAELHIYTGIGHGFGVRERNRTPSHTWPERFREWMQDQGFLGYYPN